MLQGVRLMRLEGGLEPVPGLYQAQDLLVARRAELDEQGRLAPPAPPPTVAELIATAALVTDPLAAVEATWDGDTQGWFVRLQVIVRRPGRDHARFDETPLTTYRDGGDMRLFTGEVPPWPEAQRAAEQGQAVARHFGVPFHFSSPDEADDLTPRWWDAQPG
ncbi:hypothetical protein [Actinoplanes sp. NPDC051851]|uniref:hypothetical protein n=1 Tax=Actinoplanes sp. NPDC051851 TaxID=3154753 RepID=UPI003416511D